MKVYCSTGAFVGRINDRNYKLIAQASDVIQCDGFEFMVFGSWAGKIIDIAHYVKEKGLNIPVVHADKGIGDLISDGTKESYEKALNKFILNCKAASVMGAEYIIIHPWGPPNSDENIDKTKDFIAKLFDASKDYNVELLIEAVIGKVNNPLYNIKKVLEILPDAKLVIDTRHLAFHGILGELYKEEGLFDKIEHVHISDYDGQIKEWSKLRPVLHPGEGNIDFSEFFSFLKSIGYNKGITLESGSIKACGIDTENINNSLRYIKQFA